MVGSYVGISAPSGCLPFRNPIRPVRVRWADLVRLARLNLKDYEDFKEHHALRILGAE
jgi:hypothetical protein